MLITSIQIIPGSDDGPIKATAEVVLNDSLALKGIKVMQGRYGLFLAFPSSPAGNARRVFETVSMRFRKELQDRILKAYRDCITKPVSLFG